MTKIQNLLVLPSVQNVEEAIRGAIDPITITKAQYHEVEFSIINNQLSLTRSGIDLNSFSNVWLSSYWGTRDLAYAVKLYLENFNIPHTYVETGTSKITDQVVFSLNSISTPNTFFIFKSNISDHLDAIEATCGYPLIIKDTTGAGGKLSVLVKDRQELIAKSALLPKNKKFLYQKFIPNDFDWGILVANGEVVSAEKSYPKNGEFRNNSCNGATEEFVEIATVPEHIKTIAVQANNLLGLSWSRSDIIVDKNTGLAYLMEVNRCPGISIDTDEVSGARKFLWSQLTA